MSVDKKRRRLQRPCRTQGCTALHRNSNSYCDEHQSELIGWARSQLKKGNTTKRGYGAAWRRIRSYVLQRDKYLCVPCFDVGRVTEAAEVDHKVPLAEGGTEDVENLQAICTECHKKKTQTESKRARAQRCL